MTWLGSELWSWMVLQATLNKVRDIVSAGSECDELVKAHKNTNRVSLRNFGKVATSINFRESISE